MPSLDQSSAYPPASKATSHASGKVLRVIEVRTKAGFATLDIDEAKQLVKDLNQAIKDANA